LPEWRKEAAVEFEARGVHGKEKGWKRIEYKLLVLLGRRGREEEQARGRDTVAARWRPAAARVTVALTEEDSGGGKQDRERGRVTRGGRPSRRWCWGRARVAVSGASAGGRGQSRGAEDARGRRREGGPRDSFGKIEKSKDPTLN
jgi:hypothetical protein